MTFGSRLVVSGLCVAGQRLRCLFGINTGELYYTTTATTSWSSKAFSNVFLQSLSLAHLKGLVYLFMVTAASIRAA